MRPSSALAPALIALVAVLAGCSRPLLNPSADAALAAELSRIPYPKDAKLGADLDIVVIRDGRYAQLVNRTARSWTDVQIWLNQQYVGQVPAIAIGTDNTLDLVDFINQFGEPFPTGSLLRPEDAYPIVLAEIIDPATGLRHRLVVRPEEK